MTKKELAQICIDRLKAEYPLAECTLDYDHAWQLLVEVRLAAQCTDARVNVVVQELFAKYPSVEALAAGHTPHSDQLLVTRETAPPALAQRLGLAGQPSPTLVFVRRRVLADDLPVLYSTDILPLALFDGQRLDTLDFTQPIFDIVSKYCHVEVTKTLAHLRAVTGSAAIRRQLGLRPDQALMQLEETCYSRLCQPVLCCQTCYTDFFDFAIVRKLM